MLSSPRVATFAAQLAELDRQLSAVLLAESGNGGDGVRVLIKPTDFKADQLFVVGETAGGMSLLPDDQVVIRVLDLQEIPETPFRVDMAGNINVPLVGRLRDATEPDELLFRQPQERAEGGSQLLRARKRTDGLSRKLESDPSECPTR